MGTARTGAAGWSAATAFCGAAHGFWQLLAARVGIGAGEAGCLPPSQSLICDYVPLQRRAGIFALHNLGNYVGMVAGLMLAGGLVERFGWRWTFVAIGMPGLVLALIVRVTLQEPQRGRFESVHSKSAYLSLTATVGRLWRCRTYRLMVCFYAINGFVQYGLGQWWPSFYLREFPVGMSRIGIYLGLGIGVGSMVGSLAGGLLANAMRTSLRRPLVVGAVATLVAAPTVLLSLFIGSFTGSVLLVAVTAALWSMSNGPIIATVNSVVSSSVRATAASITVFSASVLGFGLGPLCVGIFSDSLADSLGNQALRYAMLVPVSLLPVMSFVLYRASTTVSDDLDGAEDGIGQTEADYGVRV